MTPEKLEEIKAELAEHNLSVNPISENTTTPNSPNVAMTDENLDVNAIFQQTIMPSLARQIFSVAPLHGPTGALFNLEKKYGSNDFELLRENVSIFNSTSISTGMTHEVIEDIFAQFGKDANDVVGKLLRGLANDQENTNCITFLNNNCVAGPALTLSNSLNAETNVFEISQSIAELVMEINSKTLRTYEAWAVLPYKAAASFMALGQYMRSEDDKERGLFIGRIGNIKYYTNPDATSTTMYVGLKDPDNISRSSAVFSPYASNVVEALNRDSGQPSYFIYNRYAMTVSPLHTAGIASSNANGMLYSVNLTF